MSFEEWNNVLFHHYFNENMLNQRVRLYVTTEVIDELGNQNGLGNLGVFLEAVEEGPQYADGQTLYDKVNFLRHLVAQMNQQQRLQYIPTFMPYLCLFALAARYDIGENVHQLEYYDRLHVLRGQPNGDRINAIQMADLFGLAILLEEWSQWRHYQLGRFSVVHRVGAHRYTSFWRSQVLLSTEQRQRLPRLFYELELDPLDLPAEEELRHLIAGNQTAADIFGNLLHNENQLNDLIEELISELKYWDGTAQLDEAENQNTSRNAQIRLVLASQNAPTRLQAFIELADTNLPQMLELQSDGMNYSCRRITSELFGPLRSGNNIIFNMANLLAEQNIELHTQVEQTNLRAIWRMRQTYYFQWYREIGQWLQRQNLDTSGDIVVLTANPNINPILNWAYHYNIPRPNFPNAGLPQEWTVVRIQPQGNHLANARNNFPGQENQRRDVSIRLVGGVRANQGDTFFDFGLPIIRIEGYLEDIMHIQARQLGGNNWDLVEILQNANEIKAPGRLYKLIAPGNGNIHELGAHLIITVIRGEEKLAEREFYVHREPAQHIALALENADILFNLLGDQVNGPLAGNEPLMLGATITGNQPEPINNIGNGQADPVGEEYNSQTEKFLQVLSTLGNISLQIAKDLAYDLIGDVHGAADVDEWRDIIWMQFKALRWLGHCEIVEEDGRWSRLIACPPALVLLPGQYYDLERHWHLFRAVLCGQRTQGALEHWIQLAHDNHNVEVLIHSQAQYYPLVPQRILFQSHDIQALHNLAQAINPNIPLQRTAQRILAETPDIEVVRNILQWEPGRPPLNGWRCRIFNPNELHTVAVNNEWPKAGNEAQMAEMCNLQNNSWYHCLYGDGQRARISREIGRWLVCAPVQRPALRTAQGDLLLPVELEPNGVWGRGFALCSGFAPKIARYNIENHPFLNGESYPLPPEPPIDSMTARRQGQYSGHFYIFARAANWFAPNMLGLDNWQDVGILPLEEINH